MSRQIEFAANWREVALPVGDAADDIRSGLTRDTIDGSAEVEASAGSASDEPLDALSKGGTYSYSGGTYSISGGDNWDTLKIKVGTLRLSSSLSVDSIEELKAFGTFIVTNFDLNQFDVVDQTGKSGFNSFYFRRQVDLEGVEFTGEPSHLIGSSYDDVLNVSTATTKMYLDGNEGNDTLIGSDQMDWINGGVGDDSISGGGAKDRLTEDGGNNTIYGGEGNDVIIAVKGNDLIDAGDGADKLYLQFGSYVANAGSGNDLIDIWTDRSSGQQTLVVDGGSGDDKFLYAGSDFIHATLHGGDGNDKLISDNNGNLSGLDADGIETLVLEGPRLRIDADTLGSFEKIECKYVIPPAQSTLDIVLTGGGSFAWHAVGHQPTFGRISGSDERDRIDLSNSRTNWTVHGRGGDDLIATGGRGDAVFGNTGADRLVGYGSKGDSLDGGTGNDTLYGYGADELMHGRAGDDRLVAGAGLDKMYGGSGNDRFVFSDGVGGAIIYDFRHTAGESDIMDFSHVSAVKNFSDLMAHHVKMMDDNHVLLITYGTSEIAIVGLKTDDLQKADFHF